MNKLTLTRNYSIALFALVGLLLGLALMRPMPLGSTRVLQLVLIVGGIPLIWSTTQNILKGRLYVDTIASLAIVGCLFAEEYLAGVLVVLMQAGGEALEDFGLRRANRSLENLLRRAPTRAQRKTEDGYEEVPASEVEIGDILRVRQGDIIVADGVILEGQGNVDEAALTGEPVPLAKYPGDRVYSGTINLSGSFSIATTNTAAESKYELIVRMVQQAEGERAPINRLANRYAPLLTFVTFVVAILILFLTRDPVRGLAVLVVATPCPLIIATPLAVLSAINRSAAFNIIVKSGAAIESAATIDTVVFDKTGTLTEGEPALSELRFYGGAEVGIESKEELLSGIASIELLSSHILATSILQEARKQNIGITPADEVYEMPGAGVAGWKEGHRFAIGTEGFVRALEVDIPPSRIAEHEAFGAVGKTVAYVAVDNLLVGMMVFEDKIRPEAKSAIQRLRSLGIKRIVMLTGDAEPTARSVAKELGIEDVRFRMHPEEKLQAIEALEQEGNVMMVGDGINDAPALVASTVGVAMGGYGAGIATDAADVVITVENVERVADTILLGRRMVRVATQGIVIGLGVSGLLMALAGAGHISPPVGALLQEILDLATILNALRVR